MASDTPVVTGVDALVRHVEAHKKETAARLRPMMLEIGNIIAERADFLCPKDTLALVKSRQILIEGSGFNLQVRVTYGGPTAPYALWVHEDLNKHHDHPTTAKWVEIAVRETRQRCALVADKIFSAQHRVVRFHLDETQNA